MATKTVKKTAKKAAAKKQAKMVYAFGGGKADGNGKMKELLGGKGANLAEMAGTLKLPVPPGFTITTEVCTYYWNNKRTYPKTLKADVEANLKKVEKLTKKQFGSEKNPLLVSVRSGARASMPGMMETILNIGLTEKTIPGMIAKTGDERFVYDAYRRLIMMYSDVVMEKAAGIEPKDGEGIRKILDGMMEKVKEKLGVSLTAHLDPIDLNDSEARELEAKVADVIKKDVSPDLRIHDFRLIRGAVDKAIFDAVAPFDCKIKDEDLRTAIEIAVGAIGKYIPVVTIERE